MVKVWRWLDQNLVPAEDAAAGEEILIAKAGKPIAKLVPVSPAKPGKRRLGILGGRINLPDDFDAPLPQEILDAFDQLEPYSGLVRRI